MQSAPSPTNRIASPRLVLGGHSFISQLGNDPAASEREQLDIVESCLNNGIRGFDTTYQPERTALGKALALLGRRDEATIYAWNFFTDFVPGEPVGKAELYQPHHIDLVLEQLRTRYVDCLVVVPSPEDEHDQRQIELLTEWRRKGYVRALGLWVDDVSRVSRYHDSDQFSVAIRPFNITTGADGRAVFAAYRSRGWETLATSPFFRGWELDRIVTAASVRGGYEAASLRTQAADLMLRYALFEGNADRIVVAMRKAEWIRHNLESIARGPLTEREHRLLQKLRRLAEKRWWQKLRLPKRRRKA